MDMEVPFRKPAKGCRQVRAATARIPDRPRPREGFPAGIPMQALLLRQEVCSVTVPLADRPQPRAGFPAVTLLQALFLRLGEFKTSQPVASQWHPQWVLLLRQIGWNPIRHQLR
ncbi:hypothetical protein AB838_05715 [Rhodobacteraceae bacterium (ex Bugula neritina AB1)]|nr:hypothetical protein AB838_05715 [Rhodobacteraceae bacterium (ex Bugula neritina AB1)]